MAVFDSPDNITGLTEFIQYTNNLTNVGGAGGLLGISILLIIFVVSFITSKAFSYDRSLGFASFFSLIVAVFLRFMQLINDGVLVVMIILFIASLYFLNRDRSFEQA